MNKSRSIRLLARNKVVLKLMNKAQLELKAKFESDAQFYRKFLKDTMLEALIMMMERHIYVRCLEKDVEVVEGLIDECVSEYKASIKE